ncbi:MAG: NAD(P)-dependent oxidoreductase [Roseibium sp.]|nr:NAD(P)-dependent oxidoreductase [Roseibium sp.]
MGAPMARRLADAGHDLHVWNRTQSKSDALSDCAQVAPTPFEAVNDADIVVSMLLDGPVTYDILARQGCLDAARRGTLFIDMGSVDPDTDRKLSALATRQGHAFLDAPVSGGVVGAEAGTLSIFVGGTPEAFERAGSIFSELGRPTLLGECGAGQVAKLANQLIVAATIGAVAEGLRLGQAGGCDIALLRDALKGGFADSRILELHGKRMVTGNFVPGGRSVAQLKDIDNAMKLAEASGLDLPLADCVQQGFRNLVENHDFKWLALR